MIRLGDFDLKSPEAGKAEYWKSTERKLVEEGWYTATENPSRALKEVCLLSGARQRVSLMPPGVGGFSA